jgi:hypothetical protein
MAKKKITSITQIPGDGEQNSKPASGFYRPEFKLTQKGTKWPFPMTLTSKNPAAKYVQQVVKQSRTVGNKSPLDQLKRS